MKMYNEKKQELKDIIYKELEEHKNLVQVKDDIEKIFEKSLSAIDSAYIERKYVNQCLKLWLKEIADLFKQLSDDKRREVFNLIDNMASIDDIPNIFKELNYYKLLIEHYELVSKENEKILITKFKDEYLKEAVAYCNVAENELEFLETFIDFLNASKHLQSIVVKLELQDFCCGKLSFEEFLKRVITYDFEDRFISLHETAKCLQEENKLFFVEKFKEVLSAYIAPTKLKETKIDGRLVIEVRGQNIVISEILCDLEEKLSENLEIEEVRFIDSNIIHIDSNLENEIWRGKNIVILTKVIKIYGNITWNVSGKNNNHTYADNAATGEDGHGKQGADGFAGESGGNILILMEEMENPENFTIISNGGKGSKGQDGGNGRDGEDGKSITKTEFNEKFPSCVKLFSGFVNRKETITTIMKNIEIESSTIETLWYKGTSYATIEKITEDMSFLLNFEEDIFIETITRQGGRIIFSYCIKEIFTIRQAFFLYRGPLGQPGGHGGEYGLGGEGGYAGEIKVMNLKNNRQEFGIIIHTRQGEEGEKGQGGLYGNHGKNGLDMGYLDYLLWKEAKFHENSKYKIEYYENDNDPSTRVWCPYKDRYAGFISDPIENQNLKKYEERKSTRQNKEREHHAQAVKKKNISQGSILANYSHHLISLKETTLQHLRSDLENTKQRSLQAICENLERPEEKSRKLEIKRYISCTRHVKNKRRNDILPNVSFKVTTNSRVLIDKFNSVPQLLDNLLQLKDLEVTHSELYDLLTNFEEVKKKLQSVENVLADKYKNAIMYEIAKLLPPYQEIAETTQLTLENAVRYLVEKGEDNNISHPILGTLHQYLYEYGKDQHEKILKFCKEELNKTKKALKCLIKRFILKVGKTEDIHANIKRYYEEYEQFLEKQEHSVKIYSDTFLSELSREEHSKILNLWIESFKDKSVICELEREIEKDIFLQAVYKRCNNQLKQEYDWDRCYEDQVILNEFDHYILENVAFSENRIEFLAFIFDINIRLYVENQDSQFTLQDSYNSSSKQIIYLLKRNENFIQLNIDTDYFKLEKERQKRDELYGNIFAQVDSFKQKREFDEYLEKQTFLIDQKHKKSDQSFCNESNFGKEEEDIKEIIEYFPTEDREQIRKRLEKITSRYIGEQKIITNILKRFSNDGLHVSSQELCCLINAVLTSHVEDRKENNIFCWVIAAYPQQNWIDELLLLKFERYFKKQLKEKLKWRKYLSKIINRNILLSLYLKLDQNNSNSIQCIENILYLLSSVPEEIINLEELELSEWPYALKEKYWTHKLSKLLDWQDNDLPTATYHLLLIENIFGTTLAEKFTASIKQKVQELSPEILIEILSNFHNEKWNLSEEELAVLNSCNIYEWAQKMQQKFTADDRERDVTQLVKLMQGNANTSEGISDSLSKIENSIRCICNEKYVIKGILVKSFTESDIKNWVKTFQNRNVQGKKSKKDFDKEMLAVIDRAIELKRGFNLRDTQRLAVLALLTNDRGTLAQVSTGEGKSLIVVAASIMKTLYGEKVDIITSSSVLAKRDAEGNKDIYSLFDIDVSHNCSEDIEKRREAYFGNQVIYGDLANFQRDYLLDRFYGKNILGDRNFKNVIIDEVYSMLLDKGNHMLYLSHDLSGLDKLESLYLYIWTWINRPANDEEEICYAFNAKVIKEAVLNDIYDLIKKDDIGKLDSDLNEQEKTSIWECLIKAKVLDGQGKLLKDNIKYDKLDEILGPKFCRYQDRLKYLLKQCIERKRFIHVPNYLRPFIEQHLESWINSAITAFFMKVGQDYVVDVDRTGTSLDRNPIITILDRNTGTDQANSQWNEALHQFLQLKHGCKLSLQSLKAVFISNVSFFKLYYKLYGLTGTLGSQRERNLLQEIYDVDFVTIPTAKSKQFREEKSILCSNKEMWVNRICNEVKKLTKDRSVLVICETVEDVEILHKAFGGRNAKQVKTYTRDYEEFEIAQGIKELEQGQVIIATNLAGRGTDIKITKALREAGGLHICLTYLPGNIRIEEQAFGRAARSGDKGSGQLIIMEAQGAEYSNLKILDLKKERNAEELSNISNIKAYYESHITVEEDCFKAFKKLYEQLKKDLDSNKIPVEVKNILLQSCLDKWAFWLDEHSKYIDTLTDDLSKRDFKSLLNKFISHLKNFGAGKIETKFLKLITVHDCKSWLPLVEDNPVQMVKLGKYLAENTKHENALESAIELFDKVIKQEPYFSEVAHYYKAFALSKKIDWQQKPLTEEDKKVLKAFKQELRETVRLLDERSNFTIEAAAIIGAIKKNNTDSIIQIDAYEEQQNNLINIYFIFTQSINDILGHFISPQSFINYGIEEELVKIMYDDLVREGIVNMPKIKKNISEEELKMISSDYGVSVKMLKDVLSKFEGKEIKENEFQKVLKNAVPLPSREEFWKSLVQLNVLNDDVKYVVVDSKKLKEVDPSLLDSLKIKLKEGGLKQQSLEFGNDDLVFNLQRIQQQRENKENLIFKKADFKAIVQGKYQILKKMGVLSFNRKGHIDKSKIKSVNLPHYDSITLDDLINVDIPKNEAENILADLVKQRIIEEKESSQNNGYNLKIQSDEINQIYVPHSLVYKDSVKRLLSVCFTYRIALQEIANSLEEENYPIHFKLMTKPHQSIIFELMEQKIIRPGTMIIDNLEKQLNNLYRLPTNKDSMINMLSQNKLVPDGCTTELFNHLVEMKWICNPISGHGSGNPLKTVGNILKSVVPGSYSINVQDKGCLKPFYKNIEDTVKKILKGRLELAKEDTIIKIINILEQSGSVLKRLKVADVKLKPFTEFCGQNIEEVHVFFLNGLDQLIQLEEKKWTQKMLLNTAGVVAIGIGQIIIGTAIQLYSMGITTQATGPLIGEGVSDIIFAADIFRRGYFSWSDYIPYKLFNLVTTITTFGIGTCLAKGAKGSKLALKTVELSEDVAAVSGNKLIRSVGYKGMGKAVTKRVIRETFEKLALGLANMGVDILIQDHLERLCVSISSRILSNIEQKVEEHDISKSLEKAYKLLGEQEAKKMIDQLTNKCFVEKGYSMQLLFIAESITEHITQKIVEVVKKRYTSSDTVDLLTNMVEVSLKSTGHIYKITQITNNLLNNLNKEMINKLNSNQLNDNQIEAAEKDYESFRKEVIDKWKSLVHQEAGRIIQQHIVNPILKKGMKYLIGYLGRKLQEVHQSNKESEYSEEFEKIKQKYHKELRDSSRSQTGSHITEEYHKDLLKLMLKTKDPLLLAAIIRENVAMNKACVGACIPVIHQVLEQEGIRKFTIIVEGDYEENQRFSSGLEGDEGVEIKIKLKNNHFQLCENDTNSNEQSKNNHCLYTALIEAVPQLKNMTSQEFRAKLANCIEQNPKVQYNIQQNWSTHPSALNVFDGKRIKDHKLTAKELHEKIMKGEIKFSQDSISDHTRKKGNQVEMHIGKLGDRMKQVGWEGHSIRAVKMEDVWVVYDHRRTIAAAVTQSPDLGVHMTVYEPDDTLFTQKYKGQYKTVTAGEAVKTRIESGKSLIFNDTGFDSSQVRIRARQSDYPNKVVTERKLKDMNFQFNTKLRKTQRQRFRSNSLSRSSIRKK